VQAGVRFSFASATKVIVLGEASKLFVTEILRVPPERVQIINNGVPKPIIAREPMSRCAGTRRLFFLGNLSERKGVSDLLRALAASELAKHGSVDAVFAGGGDIKAYETLAAELGISSFTKFVGWADQIVAAKWMATADVLVLPSYDEGLPLVILEALGQGVAVICTPVGEIPHNLEHGVNAHFVPPGDIAALAKGIDKVLGDEAYRQELESRGLDLFLRKYALDQFSDSVAKVHLACFGAAARPVAKQGGGR